MPFLKLKLSCLAILTVLIPTQVIAQDSLFKENWYVALNGTQGEAPLTLSLIEADGAVITGKSCAKDDGSHILYRGTMDGLHLNLTAQSQGELVGSYTLSPSIIYASAERRARNPRLNEGYIRRYLGQYEDYKTGEIQNVDLEPISGFYGTPEKRYVDFHGNDQLLETFARKVISSFLNGDKQWLSQNVNYPARMYVAEGKTVEVNSPTEFIKNYDIIATDTLLAKMSSWPTCNFWSNHAGVALGRGKIWIWRGENSTDENPVYGIRNVVSF